MFNQGLNILSSQLPEPGIPSLWNTQAWEETSHVVECSLILCTATAHMVSNLVKPAGLKTAHYPCYRNLCPLPQPLSKSLPLKCICVFYRAPPGANGLQEWLGELWHLCKGISLYLRRINHAESQRKLKRKTDNNMTLSVYFVHMCCWAPWDLGVRPSITS